MKVCALIACVVAAAAAASPASAAGRDDTAWLQAKLEAGGSVFLPKLPNGECYATRGLWVPVDDTRITSDGACIVALGASAPRNIGGGKPVRSTSVFQIDHVNIFKPQPVRVSVSNLEIRIPATKRMYGIRAFAHEITLDHVTVTGSPLRAVQLGSGQLGAGGMSARMTVRDCAFAGGRRDVVTVFGPIRLTFERNTLRGGRAVPKRYPGAGLHIVAADRGQPALDVHVRDNQISDNAGPGILLDLDPRNGPPVLASGIEIARNQVLKNAKQAPVPLRGGIVIAGGQDDGTGQLALNDNVVRLNRGPGILGRKFRFTLAAAGNDLRGNRGGATRGLTSTRTARALAGTAIAPATTATGARDDTSWLQARLDARGGNVFLPRLPNDECYATRGLWVSRDDTTITSDGACIVSLGPGATRLHSIDGDPIDSNAVFFVNRSSPRRPAPVRVTISNLRIVVPDGQTMYGVAIFGHHITLDHLTIEGAPKDDVLIGARANGNGYVGRVAVLESTLRGAGRNAISAFGVIGLRVEGNTIEGVRDMPRGSPAAGIDVEPDDRAQPTLDVHIVRNTIRDNAGPGVLFELEANSGLGVIATDLEISGNTIVRNGNRRTPPKRAGIVLAGGQDDGDGALALKDNTIRDNGGPGILALRLRLRVDASGNAISGNEAGATSGLTLAR